MKWRLSLIEALSAAALLLLPTATLAQTAPKTWAQSVLAAPVVTPSTGDTCGFVHNGLTAQAPIADCGSGGGSGYTVTINTVSSGTANTLGSITANLTVQNWTSTTAGAKTQTIPGCASSISGYEVDVKDTAGTAETNNYSVVPASGTIDGISSFPMTQAKQAVRLVCDGSSNWLVL